MLPGVLECAVIGVPDAHSGEVPKLLSESGRLALVAEIEVGSQWAGWSGS